MITEEEFGVFIAEFEGFRDSILDMMIDLRKDIEKLREEIERMKESRDARLDSSQLRLRL